MRTVVPLVRELSAEDLARPIVVEFEVPAQADDPAPPVFVGVRLAAEDSSASAARVYLLRDAGVTAEVHLARIQGTSTVPVALQRSQWVGRDEVEVVPLDADGHVPGLLRTDADFTAMRDAGLLRPDSAYEELELAFLRDTPPGHYRLELRFGGNVDALSRANPELLIAFTAKSK